ncbi:helix-turn-helix domain-containing protein [Lysobacter sp. F60174L2]|uniref:helix-turn-helix domain-containing protein n=1 Tax=Lysobacter sp. F60174L2 TaxID=3459295 RepID=UPI00403E267D
MDHAEYACIEVDGFAADALQGVISDTRFEQRLLSPGHFRARAQRVRFPGFTLDCGTYTLPVFANGSFGDRVLGLALALRGDRPIWLNGAHTRVGQLLIFSEGRELSVRPQSDIWQWAVLRIPRELLQQAALARYGRELEIPAKGWELCKRPADDNVPLQYTIRGALQSAASWTPSTPASETLMMGRWLLDAFLDAVWKCMDPGMDEYSRLHQHREALVRRAEAFLLSTIGREFSSAALCETLHLSERQVQRIFNDAFGVGPLRWHLIARLNHVRNALQHEPGLRVTDAALRAGFTHLSRFSREYRSLFGECPRETGLH